MDDTLPKILFWHYLEDEPENIHHKLLDTKLGPYLYFRRSKTPLQAYLTQLIPHENIPRVFLHGSPHIDNYAKTTWGYGMTDFDRAYVGPYIWDIVCVLLAINLRNPETHHQALAQNIYQTFFEVYFKHFEQPDLDYLCYHPLEMRPLKPWEQDIDLYLKEQHKWAKKLYHAEISIDDTLALALLEAYKLNSADRELFTAYHLKKIARTYGSFGRRRYLYLLEHDQQPTAPIMLDIKETRNYLALDWPHNQWYTSPCEHQGERMIKAAQLYAPNSIKNESYATLNGIQYWGRQIPILNKKPAKFFRPSDQLAFAIAAASQLGRGHRLGLEENQPNKLQVHFEKNYAKLAQIIETIQIELLNHWALFVDRYED